MFRLNFLESFRKKSCKILQGRGKISIPFYRDDVEHYVEKEFTVLAVVNNKENDYAGSFDAED